MGKVSSLFARKVVEQTEGSVDRDVLLRSVGLMHDGPVDATLMIEDDAYYGLLERAAAADPRGASLPLRTGATMRCDEYGAFGLAWKSAPTLLASYDRAVRYARVLTSVSRYEVEKTFNGAFLHLKRDGARRLGLRLSNEATLASITAISREVSSAPFRPEAVHFKHAAPRAIAAHEDYFECPVYFGSDRDALLVSSGTLNTPNKLGDAGLVTFFDTHLTAEISGLDERSPLDRQLRDHISTSLSEGVPALSDVARHLGMSARTLQRRLSEQGSSYQTLVDESRRELAERLLRETDFSLMEVTFMTGFSEQSAFTRAFKRWAGHTPRSFRLEAQGTQSSS